MKNFGAIDLQIVQMCRDAVFFKELIQLCTYYILRLIFAPTRIYNDFNITVQYYRASAVVGALISLSRLTTESCLLLQKMLTFYCQYFFNISP